MAKRFLNAVLVAAALAGAAACTVHQTTAPSLTGPSEFSLSVGITAQPDSINQDGGSQSAIKVSAHDANGKPVTGQSFRLDVVVNGSQTDYGTLSARTIVTGGDGNALATYTAPPPQPAGATLATCRTFNTPGSLAGQCVTITATPIGTDFASSQTQAVEIRLTPVGVIAPPGNLPVPSFVVSPTPVSVNIPAVFDASASCGGPLSGGACNQNGTFPATITSYAWNFGDGATGSGKTASHTYTTAGAFTATLTVTNNSNLSNSTTQTITVSTPTVPTGDFVFSPAAPAVGDTVFFNGTSVLAAPGHSLVQFTWDFGDGASDTGLQTQHKYTIAGTYQVVLSVADDTGQKKTFSHAVVVGLGNPVAVFTVSPPSPVHGNAAVFDASATTTAGGATIVEYDWSWGDGSPDSTVSTASTTHTFTAAGTYVVRLTVKDSANPQRVGVFSTNVTVQ